MSVRRLRARRGGPGGVRQGLAGGMSGMSGLSGIAGAGGPLADIKTSLISWWELGEASGTRVDSVTASGNDLTDNNTVTQAAGKVGNAAQFTAANLESLSRASNASLQMGDIDFTVALWVYFDSVAASQWLVAKDNDGGTREYGVFMQSPNFSFEVFTAGNTSKLVSKNVGPAISTWYFVVAWHDAAANTSYISVDNGAAASLAIGGSLQGAGTVGFYIGRRELPGAPGYTSGRIDQVGLWKRTLMDSERAALYNGGNGVAFADLP